MNVSHQLILGWTIVDWAQILGGVVAASVIAAGVLKMFRQTSSSNINVPNKKDGSKNATQTAARDLGASTKIDKAIDRLTVAALVAPAIPSVASTVCEVVKDRFSEHALNAIAAKTSIAAELAAGDLAVHAADAAGAAGDLAGHVATNHADSVHDIVGSTISHLLG